MFRSYWWCNHYNQHLLNHFADRMKRLRYFFFHLQCVGHTHHCTLTDDEVYIRAKRRVLHVCDECMYAKWCDKSSFIVCRFAQNVYCGKWWWYFVATHITRGIYFRRYFLLLSINALARLSLVAQLFLTDNVCAVCGLMFLFGFFLFFFLLTDYVVMMIMVTA